MYVGAWQEYKLMKVIENLRVENERLRQDAPGSAGDVASENSRRFLYAVQGSSHHFPVGLDDVPAGGGALPDFVSSTSKENTNSTPTPVRRRGCQNSKAATLRLIGTVRDVDVFVEEEANAGVAPLSSSVSVISRSCSEGMENKKSLSFSRNKSCEHENQVRLCFMNNPASSGTNPATTVHAELGTGRIRGVPQRRATPLTDTDGGSNVLPSLMESSRVRDNPFLKELLRGGPLDTKTKYQQAGQPLPESQAPKKNKKGPGLSEEEVQKRIERRLRLQMLYSGKLSGNETALSAMKNFQVNHHSNQVPPAPSEENSQRVNGVVSGTGKPFPSVPWDFSPSVPPNTSAAGATTLVENFRDTSAAIKQGFCASWHASPASLHCSSRHPYDVGVALSSPPSCNSLPRQNALSPLSRSGTRNPSAVGDRHDNGFIGNKTGTNFCGDGPHPGMSSGHEQHAEAEMQKGLSTEAFHQFECPVFAGNSYTLPALGAGDRPSSEAGPKEDDSIGMLINWAEQLDPDSIV
ncbi:hypothetical protein C3747_2g267 [Trypanosoma cruzi]|uniref:Uncharacterized protein n=2 Tax=Trypanosoma cruzi TaxID=5693 RepID=Q4DRE3_TRYCC|nr:hypothetical protein, conserved [Trypanosoma cruzi]EAN95083.1 hypothetical protein, conserved [Trypanosoma cruzi]PWV21670.1 hypothetical protein C3747_2g267 [Trypanosoma cruzi]RNC61651.1 hypothetical protein TcCL_ESM00730 [Trypanosoma cruzi]|eukprot:XP_816934.1 hypothetical protein [Trypanosoma cruzi strain CL Brener]